jgi:hypothetical protein
METRDRACLLSRAPSGDRFTKLTFFLQCEGLATILARAPQKPGATPTLPDLFSFGEVSFKRKAGSGAAFLSEFTEERSFAGLGRTWVAFTRACEMSRFLELNLHHLETFESAWVLTETALEAFAVKPHPELTLLKFYYLFARSEGYPVFSQWLKGKAHRQQADISQLLSQPNRGVQPDPEALRETLADLKAYLSAFTDLRVPDTKPTSTSGPGPT